MRKLQEDCRIIVWGLTKQSVFDIIKVNYNILLLYIRLELY